MSQNKTVLKAMIPLLMIMSMPVGATNVSVTTPPSAQTTLLSDTQIWERDLTRAFHNAHIRFNTAIASSKTADIQTFNEGLNAIYEEAEKYFTQNNIKYSYSERQISGLKVNGIEYPTFEYREYILEGITNPQSKFGYYLEGLFGFRSKGKTTNFKLIYSPLYNFVEEGLASYNRKSMSLRISYRAISEFLFGVTDFLGHEIVHAIEHQKILDDKFSLARFNVTREYPLEEIQSSYGEYYSLDEAEAHLRDLKFISSAEAREGYKYAMSNQFRSDMYTQKQFFFDEESGNLNFMIPDARSILNTLKKHLESGSAKIFQRGFDGKNMTYIDFAVKIYGESLTVRYYTSDVSNLEKLKPRQIIADIDSSLERLKVIEEEVAILPLPQESQLPPLEK